MMSHPFGLNVFLHRDGPKNVSRLRDPARLLAAGASSRSPEQFFLTYLYSGSIEQPCELQPKSKNTYLPTFF